MSENASSHTNTMSLGYQSSRSIVAHAIFVTTHTYICIQHLMYNSYRNHVRLTIPHI